FFWLLCFLRFLPFLPFLRLLRSSAGEDQIAASLSKRGQCPLPSCFGVGDKRAECRDVAKRVELRPDAQRRRREIAYRHRPLQVRETAHGLADVAEEPSFLKDR